MDPNRFDALARSWPTRSRSRLLGVILAGTAGLFTAADTTAKKKKGKKGKKKKQQACDVGRCNGCCNDAGDCVSGQANAACGTNGFPCDDCAAQGLSCVLPDRTCGCDVAQCSAGCCDYQGLCRSGTTREECGAEGKGCESCHEGHQCLTEGNTRHCCGLAGAFCGEADILFGPIVIGRRTLNCCDESLYCHPSSETCVCQGKGQSCDAQRPCCNGAPCEIGICDGDCLFWGCPDGFACCTNTGECLSTTKTNCRRHNGALFTCEPGLACCRSSNNAGCGGGVQFDDACATAAGFEKVDPVTCA